MNIPAVFQEEENPWRCGRIVTVLGIEGGCTVIGVTEAGRVDVFHPDTTRGSYAPELVTLVPALPAWDSKGEHPNGRKAMERFQGRVLEHARRPGGTKPGHTVTPESAGNIARTVATRNNR